MFWCNLLIYAPRIPIAISWTPPMKRILIIILVQPWTKSFRMNFEYNAYNIPRKATKEKKNPIKVTICNG